MLAAKTIIATALLAQALPSMASPTLLLLDFETVAVATTDLSTAAGNPYLGQGISFTQNAWSMASSAPGTVNPGTGKFFRDPLIWGSQTRGAMHLTGNPLLPGSGLKKEFVINSANGFDSEFSMLYAASTSGNGAVSLFSELDGGGATLGGFNMTPGATCLNPNTGAPLPGWLCNWTEGKVSFAGKAHSIRISGDDAQFFFDDLRLQFNTSPPNPVPEPGSLALSLAAIGALAWGRKRRVS